MDRFRQILQKYWGFTQFRPLQEEIIVSVAEGNDTLALLPTGGGKSLTFQVPALYMEGLCLVVTPLIALMKDQVENLNRKNIKALAIHSGMGRNEIANTISNCIYDKEVKFLYLSPERLKTELITTNIASMRINLLAVDEAHCISQWGYDFRPSYLQIADIRSYIPEVPVLALTATATPDVVDDIQQKLLFRKPNVLRKSFERKNLVYVVRHTEDKPKQLLKICQSVKGSGVVYVRNRRATVETASLLLKNGIAAGYYHAGLTHSERNARQESWKNNKIRVIVCTNAFGMGIDKPDVRFVVHTDLPDSVEAYFQEAGRAGRDGNKAYAVLLFNKNDQDQLEERIETTFPEINFIKRIYNALGNFLQVPVGLGTSQWFNFNLAEFCNHYNFEAISAFNALKILEKEGYIELTDEINQPSKIHIQVNREDLYHFQVANENYDGFIKLLLRSYTGLFQNYVAVDENTLARRFKNETDIVIKYLERLHQVEIIDYVPQKNSPMIIFTQPRVDEKSLYLTKENYHLRKTKYKQRIEAMLGYALTQTKCRSQYLLAYFGESGSIRCGQCDICLSRNELGLNKVEFDTLLEKIKSLLKNQPMSLEQLADSQGQEAGKTVEVIRWLLDNGKIRHNKAGLLEWIEKQTKGKSK